MQIIYIFITSITAFVSISKPLCGIVFLLFNFLLQPHMILGYQPSTTQSANLLVGMILLVTLPFRKLKNPKPGASRLAIIFSISLAFSALLNLGADFFSDKYLPLFTSSLNRIGLLILLLYYISTRNAFSLTIKTLVVLGFTTSVYTIADSLFHLKSITAVQYEAGRAVGVFGDPNHHAANLAGLVPLAYYLFLHGTAKLLKRINIIAIGSLVLAIFLTVSRGGLLALTMIGGWIAKKNLKKLSTFIMLGLILMLFFSYAADLYSKRQPIETSLSGNKSLDSSAANRITILKYGLQLWIKNPIFGVGSRNLIKSLREQLGMDLRTTVHNAYVLVLVESGLVGFLLYMGFFLLAFKSLSRLSHHQDPYFNELAVYLRLALLSHMITSCFIGNWDELMLWVTFSLPIMLDQISKNEQNTASQG